VYIQDSSTDRNTCDVANIAKGGSGNEAARYIGAMAERDVSIQTIFAWDFLCASIKVFDFETVSQTIAIDKMPTIYNRLSVFVCCAA